MNRLISIAVSLSVIFSSAASVLDFTYDTYGGIQRKYGQGRAETISVAMFLGPELVGKRVVGLSVPVYGQPDRIADVSGWTSGNLVEEQSGNYSFNKPDGSVAEGVIGDDRVLRVEFSSPVEIPEAGLYVGYTFRSTTKLSGSSVAVVDGNRKGECFYQASRSKKKWGDLYEMKKFASAMTVTLDGEFGRDDASLASVGPLLALDTGTVTATIVNHGTGHLREIGYTYTVDDGAGGSGNVTIDNAVEPVYGRGARVSLSLDEVRGPGECLVSISVTSVNGITLSSPKTFDIPVTAQIFVPEFHPLVEEYTYLGCGYCPRGYVMLEQMKAMYGSEFVGVSYHSSENERKAMNCIPDSEKPLRTGSYPAAALNRLMDMDPEEVPGQWTTLAGQTTICGISAYISRSGEAENSVYTVTAKARFLKDMPSHSYRIAMILVGDGLSSDSWNQANYYYNKDFSGIYTTPFWNLFVGKEDHVRGLVFNDIALSMTDYKGVAGSLPEAIEAGEIYEFSYVFGPEALKNLNGQDIVTDYDKVRCVAMIVDGNTGRPANSVFSLYPDGGDPFPVRDDIDWTPVVDVDEEPGMDKIDPASADARIVETEYISLSGLPVDNPSKGDLLIRAEIYDNGKITYSKIIY